MKSMNELPKGQQGIFRFFCFDSRLYDGYIYIGIACIYERIAGRRRRGAWRYSIGPETRVG